MSKDASIEFKMHPQMLFDIIFRQAGSLPKAVLEGVMNSIDAGAKECRIVMDQDRVTIEDDGKGFKSREEIDQCFSTFGHPHEEGDARYGRFRMGRGQMFAFGATRYRTGRFQMDVDLKPKKGDKPTTAGLLFNLKELDKVHKGCAIGIELYERLKLIDLETHKREIESFVRYVDIPIYLNGELISLSPETQNWTHVTDEAYIKLTSNGEMKIYNDGVFVCSQQGYKLGTGGVIVSRKQLQVNFARNDVQSDCKIYRKILGFIGQQINAREKTRPLDDYERGNLLNNLSAGGKSVQDLLEMRVIQDVTGSWHPLKTVLGAKSWNGTVSVAPKSDMLGERAHTRKMGFVVSAECAGRLGAKGGEDLVKRLLAFCKRDKYPGIVLVGRDREHFKTFIDESHEHVDEKELNAAERIALRLIREGNKTLVYAGRSYDRERPGTFVSADRRMELESKRTEQSLSWQQQRDFHVRRINVGTSQTALAWTDGRANIWIDRKELSQIKRGQPGFQFIAKLLLHEYLHEGPSTGTHEHGVEFYERFHDLDLRSDMTTKVADTMMKEAVKIFTDEKKLVGRMVLQQLDATDALERAAGIAPVFVDEAAPVDGGVNGEVSSVVVDTSPVSESVNSDRVAGRRNARRAEPSSAQPSPQYAMSF